MQKISAVIISFNEANKIGPCLDSLQGVVDEIVVLDSFSTDATPEICKAYGVHFFQQDWKGYGQQKNDANALAHHDYILSVDADERLSDKLKHAILQAKSSGLHGVYKMSRLNNFYGKYLHHGITYPDTQHRLFNRKEVQWKQRVVHETIDIPATVTIQFLQGDLLHDGTDTIKDHLNTINKYTSLSAKAYFESGKRANFFNLWLNPAVAFIQGYIFKLGFLDGQTGYIVAKNIAFEVYLKYSKLLHLQQQHKL
ncbi:MAG: glycosyltransferase family 2 protein [Ferruginibacter sp.]